MDAQRLVWFTEGSGTEEGTEAGIYKSATRLLSLGKEIRQRMLRKPVSLSIGGSVGETWRAALLPETLKDR